MDLTQITQAERTATQNAGYGRLWTLFGILKGVLASSDFALHGKSPEDLETIEISISGAGVGAIHADTASVHFLLMGCQGTLDGAGTIQFREADNAPAYCGAMEFVEGGGICMPVTGYRYFRTADSKGLEMVTTGDGFKGMVQILEVDN